MDSNRYKRPYEVEDSDSSDEEYQSPLKKQRSEDNQILP